MKYTLLFAAAVLFLSIGSTRTEARHQADDDEMGMGVDMFYSNLSPYGEWVRLDIGNVWRPFHAGHGWRPYMYGHWIWSDYGWYWASDEPFGWATYHYGRWQYDDYYGWIWLPDNVWGPSWVEWRYNDDYVGWAPLPPVARFSFGVGITFGHRWYAPVHYWNFVPCRNFASVRINEYVQPIDRSRRIFGSTRGSLVIENSGDRVINRGIDPTFVERRGNIRIRQAEVITNDRQRGERVTVESGRERVEVYKPRLEGASRGGDTRTAPGSRSYNDQHGTPTRGREIDRRAVEKENAAPERENTSGRRNIQSYRDQQRQPDQPGNYRRNIESRRPVAIPQDRPRMERPQRRPDVPESIRREAPRGGYRQTEPAYRSAPEPGTQRSPQSGQPGRGGRNAGQDSGRERGRAGRRP